MYPEHGFLLLFLAIAVFLFVRAYNDGVEGMLWSVAGLCAGLVGGWLIYGLIPKILPDWEAGFRTRLFLSALVALIPYLIVRFATKALLERVFDSRGPFATFSTGLVGGALSLIPTLVTIVIIISCVRVAGTWADLRRYEKLAAPDVDYVERLYPKHPLFARWRDGIERLPLVVSAFGVFDRINRVPERNLVGLLITSKKEVLFEHLEDHPETGPIIESKSVESLLADPEVDRLNAGAQHFTMLRHVAVRAAALDPAIRENLKELELHQLVDEFMLSPERQEVIESFRRE